MPDLTPPAPPTPTAGEARPALSKRRRMLLLLLCTAVAVALYFAFISSPLAPYFWVFYVLLIGFFLVYLFYNRFFTLSNVTVDSMSPSLPLQEREAFVAGVARRKARSAWMLYVILPLSVALGLDLLFLYAGEWFTPLVTAVRNLLG